MGIKRYNENYLKNVLGVDAEEFKEDLVGSDAASFYDVARDNEKNIYLMGKENSIIDAETSEKDMVEEYGRNKGKEK